MTLIDKLLKINQQTSGAMEQAHTCVLEHLSGLIKPSDTREVQINIIKTTTEEYRQLKIKEQQGIFPNLGEISQFYQDNSMRLLNTHIIPGNFISIDGSLQEEEKEEKPSELSDSRPKFLSSVTYSFFRNSLCNATELVNDIIPIIENYGDYAEIAFSLKMRETRLAIQASMRKQEKFPTDIETFYGTFEIFTRHMQNLVDQFYIQQRAEKNKNELIFGLNTGDQGTDSNDLSKIEQTVMTDISKAILFLKDYKFPRDTAYSEFHWLTIKLLALKYHIENNSKEPELIESFQYFFTAVEPLLPKTISENDCPFLLPQTTLTDYWYNHFLFHNYNRYTDVPIRHDAENYQELLSDALKLTVDPLQQYEVIFHVWSSNRDCPPNFIQFLLSLSGKGSDAAAASIICMALSYIKIENTYIGNYLNSKLSVTDLFKLVCNAANLNCQIHIEIFTFLDVFMQYLLCQKADKIDEIIQELNNLEFNNKCLNVSLLSIACVTLDLIYQKQPHLISQLNPLRTKLIQIMTEVQASPRSHYTNLYAVVIQRMMDMGNLENTIEFKPGF